MDGHVRTAAGADALDVRRILDAAMLEPGNIEARIENADVLVAGDHRGGLEADGGSERILGAVVLESRNEVYGAHVSAIGVRRRHRGKGIGRALMERALEREGRLTVRFDDGVRPFYESLGFAIEPIDDQRYRGVTALDRS